MSEFLPLPQAQAPPPELLTLTQSRCSGLPRSPGSPSRAHGNGNDPGEQGIQLKSQPGLKWEGQAGGGEGLAPASP